MLHTHLAENEEDIAYSLSQFGCRPGQYAEDLGWTGDHVWHAHCVKLDAAEIDLFARSQHRRRPLPLLELPPRLGDRAGPRRCATPASASASASTARPRNDAGHLLSEARQALLLQRVRNGADAMSAREALEIATLGGATVLGRGAELGSIEPGKRADLAIWDVSGLERRRRLGPGGGAASSAGRSRCATFSSRAGGWSRTAC